MLQDFLDVLGPHLWWLVPALIAAGVLAFPAVGRGPNSSRYRDPWRGFRFQTREQVMTRAGNRCESSLFFAWGRCAEPATEVDHIMPWSRGGPTVLSNGQALCSHHNRSKGAQDPRWWDVLGLERRRRTYFPADADVRVFAVLSDQERAAREAWQARRR